MKLNGKFIEVAIRVLIAALTAALTAHPCPLLWRAGFYIRETVRQ